MVARVNINEVLSHILDDDFGLSLQIIANQLV